MDQGLRRISCARSLAVARCPRTVAAAQVIPGRSREELYTALDEEVRLRTQQGGRSIATASAYEEHSRAT